MLTETVGLPWPTSSTVNDRRAPTDDNVRLDCPTVILSMPFMDVDRPSIQLGLLKAAGEAHGFSIRTLHANLDFAVRTGVELYGLLAEHRGRLLGEWLFSVAAFGSTAPDHDGRLLQDFAEDFSHLGDSPEQVRQMLLRIRREEVPAYLDDLLDVFPWHEVQVVGFTSAYQQNTASFALARRLKERHPHLVTVFGGANFDGEMGLELVRTVECIDFVVVGEGDLAFPRLLSALAAGSDPTAVPGVAGRADGRVVTTAAAPPFQELDESPAPNYDEYFQRAEDLGLLAPTSRRHVWIPFESARGCWWGAKHHCTFCGLNGTTMQFRAKTPQRVFDELAEQARRYRSFRFQAVDNILDMGYLTALFPDLISTHADYEIFYEVKANLSRAQLKVMAQAGVSQIQPGLESMSSHVLKLMRKGVRAAQNVNLLRWARYYHIDVGWNILWGFPGETEPDYRRQASVLPDLSHLQPPANASRIWLERFSPLFTELKAADLKSRNPEPSYRYVYPDSVDLDKIAYFFEMELVDALPDSAYAGLSEAVQDWRTAWSTGAPPELTYRSAPGFLQIHDGRRAGSAGTYTFEGTLAEIYLACSERPITASAVRDKLALDISVGAVEEMFQEYQRRGLMFLDDSLALSLALPAVAAR